MARTADAPSADGRRARRERNRSHVIDAMFELLEAGHHPVTVDDVADAARVSPASVFRYFDGLDDLRNQTISRYFERFGPLFDVPTGDDTQSRVDAFVGARTALYEATAPMARLARARALDHPALVDALDAARSTLRRQVAEHFAHELGRLGRAERNDRIALIDALTSFESWDLLRSSHGRSTALIRRAWTTGLVALLHS